MTLPRNREIPIKGTQQGGKKSFSGQKQSFGKGKRGRNTAKSSNYVREKRGKNYVGKKTSLQGTQGKHEKNK